MLNLTDSVYSLVDLPDPLTNTTVKWSDEIPDGEFILWACTGIIKQDEDGTTWSQPRKMTDTEIWDV